MAGVYFLFKDEVLTYVGRSNDCYGRIASHRGKGRDFDLATVMPLAAEFIGLVENALIAGFTPPQNRMRPPPKSEPPAPVFLAPPPDPYADIPVGAPRPSGLGLISQAKARDLAIAMGVGGSAIQEAEQLGQIQFVASSRICGHGNRKGPVRTARYDDVVGILRQRRADKLKSLGLSCAPSLARGGVR